MHTVVSGIKGCAETFGSITQGVGHRTRVLRVFPSWTLVLDRDDVASTYGVSVGAGAELCKCRLGFAGAH